MKTEIQLKYTNILSTIPFLPFVVKSERKEAISFLHKSLLSYFFFFQVSETQELRHSIHVWNSILEAHSREVLLGILIFMVLP